MHKILISAALTAAVLAPSTALAQATPAAVVTVVNLDRITNECNACKTAAATLRSQITTIQNREKTLGQQLETEGKALQAQIDALKTATPDAALQARIKAFQSKQASAVEEVRNSQAGWQRNQQYVQQQIAQKLGPIYQQVMQRRGANIMLEAGSTLATASSLDVTAEVLAALNTAMPTLGTQAPAQAQQAPQGR